MNKILVVYASDCGNTKRWRSLARGARSVEQTEAVVKSAETVTDAVIWKRRV